MQQAARAIQLSQSAQNALDRGYPSDAIYAGVEAVKQAVEALEAHPEGRQAGVLARVRKALDEAEAYVVIARQHASMRAKFSEALACGWTVRRAWAQAALILGRDAKQAAEAWQSYARGN